MSRDMWSQLNRYSDGESLNSEVLNVPIGQLGDRTEYLYARLKKIIADGSMSAVVLTGVRLSTEAGKIPVVGNAVYLDREKDCFAAAKATMSLYDDFKAADSAFTVGILNDKDGASGSVIIYGRMNLGIGAPIPVADMIESGESFRPGRYYLSARERGKLTANPSGPLIYVCSISGSPEGALDAFGKSSYALVNPQFLDIGTSHVHRTAVLTARPAGDLSSDGKSVEGYRQSGGGPLSLVFGGTWTSKDEVNYAFSIREGGSWQTGMSLGWTENGVPHDFVAVPAPGVEVPLSNGLTVMVMDSGDSSSSSSSSAATWDTLTFPQAGRGWVNHRPYAVGAPNSESEFRVAVSGRVDAVPTTVNVVFPGKIHGYDFQSDAAGSTFSYDEVTYEFTSDKDAFPESGNVPVQRGPCVADSVLNLAKAMSSGDGASSSSGSGAASFAVYSKNASGSEAALVVMDGVESGNPVDGFTVGSSGAAAKLMVVYDGEGRVLGNAAYHENFPTYAWTSIGDLSVILFKSGAYPVTVEPGTAVSMTLLDYEPDAVYDYVLGMDAQLSNHWPPVPAKSAALLVNGVEMDNKALVPASPTVSFARDTIHWFEDDAGRRPWPDAFESRNAYIDPSEDKVQVMHWVKSFQGATGPVTSIQVREGSPLRIMGYGTEDYANVGDLEISADFDFDVRGADVPGYNVPKRARNGKLLAGPVVEKIMAGAGISVVSKPGCPAGQGTVVISLDDAFRSQFSDIALENAEQAKIGMFPYIRLKGYSTTITSPSAFTAVMRVPANLPDGSYALGIQATVFGEAGFTDVAQRWACVKMDYNILPDYMYSGDLKYSSLKTGLMKPNAERKVLIPFGHVGDQGYVYGGFDPLVVTTEQDADSSSSDVIYEGFGRDIPDKLEFDQVVPDLRPGYLVGIRLSRAVTNESGRTPYTGAIGFINLSWALTTAM